MTDNPPTLYKFETCYLLELSRFPEHFYAIIMGLEGRDILYQNPGVSLRSYVLSGTNPLQEILKITEDDPIYKMIRECESFCDDYNIHLKTQTALRSQPYEVVEQILELTHDRHASEGMMERLREYNVKVDAEWHTVMKNTLSTDVDLFTYQGRLYKQALYNLKFYASELVETLVHLKAKR